MKMLKFPQYISGNQKRWFCSFYYGSFVLKFIEILKTIGKRSFMILDCDKFSNVSIPSDVPKQSSLDANGLNDRPAKSKTKRAIQAKNER